VVDLKPAKQEDRQSTTRNRRLNRKQISLMVLISILAHGLGLFLLAKYQRSPLPGSEQADLKPIEFTVIPEEPEEITLEDDVDDISENTSSEPAPAPEPEPEPAPAPAPAPEPAPEPEPAPAPEPEPAPAPAPAPEPEPEPAPEPAPEPEPVAPPPTQPEPAPTSQALSPPKPDSVATNQPPESQPIPAPEASPTPTNPDDVSTSASDLLGGDYEQTLASGGDAFFSPEALEYNSVLNPEQLKALKGFDLSPYLGEMEGKVKPNWKPSFRQDDRTTVLTFNIEKNGQVSDLRVTQSSGSAEVDRESVEAIEKSLPFAPLPAEFPLDSLEITFSFNIHIY